MRARPQDLQSTALPEVSEAPSHSYGLWPGCGRLRGRSRSPGSPPFGLSSPPGVPAIPLITPPGAHEGGCISFAMASARRRCVPRAVAVYLASDDTPRPRQHEVPRP